MKRQIFTVSTLLFIGGGLHAQAPQIPPTAVQQTASTPRNTPDTSATAPETRTDTAVSQPAAPVPPAFTPEQLDTALAPVALYPDALLAQLLMAATYPRQVMEAAQWSKEHPEMKGDNAVKAVEEKGWDPSVASLVAFPQVLEMLSQKPEWVRELGDMFLADPDAVMNSIQKLRKKAYDAGNLKETKEQKIVVQNGGESATSSGTTTTIIEIQPSNPEVIYIPVYNPTVVYGPWWYPHPPFFWHPPYYNPVAAIIGFGAAIAISHALWSHWDWHRHDIHINVNRYNHFHGNRKHRLRKHQASWRQNIRQRNPRFNQVTRERTRQRLDNRRPGIGDRMTRPGDRTRDLQRDRARQQLQKKGVDLDRARESIRKNPDRINKAVDRANRMSPAQKQQLRDRAGVKRPTADKRPARNIKRPAPNRGSAGNRPVKRRPVSARPKSSRPSASQQRLNRTPSQMRPANLNRQMRARPSRASCPSRGGGRSRR